MSEATHLQGMVQPDAPEANFTYWAKMATWTVWEFSTLFVGINPRIGEDFSDLRRQLNRQALDRFEGIYALAMRACQAGELSNRATTPPEWLAWAKSRDLPILTGLESEVTRLWPPPEQAQPDVRDEQIVELRAKAAKLATQLTTLQTAAGQALGARERESMLKLIIGMAVAGYRFDPKAGRGDSIKDIATDLAKCGVPLSDDSVRKYLREGAALLPP